MRLKYGLIFLVLGLTACNVSVNSLPGVPTATAEPPTEPSPTPFPDTPAPAAIDAPRVEAPAFVTVRFFNQLDGWGVTEAQIVRTNDGGATWYNVTPPDIGDAVTPVKTFFLDQVHAWIQKPDFNNFPNNGLLYRTSDGGLTWTVSSTPFSDGDLSFLDATNGWMLADLGVGAGSNAVAVFQSTDGGATWVKTYTNDPNNPQAGKSLPLGGIKAGLVPLSMQTAWVTGVIYADGTVYLYRTDDRGNTWSEVDPPLPAGTESAQISIDPDAMKMVSSEDGFLAVRISTQTGEYTMQTAVYVTQDAGSTWKLTPELIPGTGSSNFLSAQEAIIYDGKQFYVTRDSARTWTSVSPDIAFGDSFANMDFVSPLVGWVVAVDPSNHRSLYKTADGGSTWSPLVP